MIHYEVITLPLAEADIQKQIDYIAFELKVLDTARYMLKGIKKMIGSLEIFPQRYGLDEDPHLADCGVRKMYYKNYKIYFLIDELNKEVYILRVFHMLSDSKNKILDFLNDF